MSITETVEPTGAGDFADVYQEQLAPVWRYVRSRVWSYHDAQDVTAEVFARAWRSWPTYNRARGAVAPWLFRIAQRTVVDWLRRRSDVEMQQPTPPFDGAISSVSEGLEAALLDQEVLTRLGWALGELSERDRNCVALRFAGGLKMAEIGEVLGLSTAAAKMALARAVRRLGEGMARWEQAPGAGAEESALLDEVIEELVVEGHPSVSSERLQELIVHLSAAHRSPLPPELPARIAACIACAGKGAAAERDADLVALAAGGRRGRLAQRLRLTPFAGLSWAALAPICLACTLPFMLAPLLALGLGLSVTFGLHLTALAAAPLVFVVLWRHFRQHRDRLALQVGAVGALTVTLHLVFHLVPGAEGQSPTGFTITDQLGTGLLLAGAFLDWRAMRRWLSNQRDRLQRLSAVPSAQPTAQWTR